MNKVQNTQSKKDKQRIKELELENALLKQQLTLIYTISKQSFISHTRNLTKEKETDNEIIKELDNSKIQKGISEELVERARINDFAFKKDEENKEKEK